MNSGENIEVKEVTYLEKLHFQKEREKLKNNYFIPSLSALKVISEHGHYTFKVSSLFFSFL